MDTAEKRASLLRHIEKYSIPEPNSGCWLWTGRLSTNGYGRLQRHGKRLQAHRAAYEAARGPIPPGLLVCHRCDMRSCVNPDHLWLGTCADNLRDMSAKGRGGKSPVYGEANGNSRLTAGDVLKIYADRRPQRVIAAEFGIDRSNVGQIKRGLIWSQLTGADNA